MILKWIDEKTVLLVGKKSYHAGEIIPADSLSDERIELFKSLKQIEEVGGEAEKPTRKPRKKSEGVKNVGPEEQDDI